MFILRKGLPLVAGSVLLLSAGTASAQMSLNDWILDLSNFGGGFVGQQTTGEPTNPAIGVDQATFTAPTRIQTVDVDGSGTLSVGDTQTAVGVGAITSFVNSNNQVFQNATNGVTNTFLGVDFEVTFTFTLNEVITSVLGDDVDFAHTGGTLTLYVDDTPDFNGNAGTGADNGVAIATFAVIPGAGGGNIDLSDLDGNVNAVFEATSITAGWLFDGSGTDLSTLLDANGDPLLIAFSDSNFDICTPGGNECEPNQFIEGGAFDALGTPYPTDFDQFDFFAEEDGSIDLALLPEPGTMAIFGLGLLGLGLAVRRRQRATA